MLPVFICEDNKFQRQMVQKIIENEIQQKKYQMEVVLSTGNPFKVLEFMSKTPKVNGLYFLDMELDNLMNGVDLARKIREKDRFGQIIFVTGASDLADLIHTHKIETMDYIVKDNLVDMVRRIKECLELASHQIHNRGEVKSNTLRIKAEDKTYEIAADDVIYFEYAGSGRIRMYTRHGVLEYEGSLKKTENENINFFHCHSSYVINLKRIKEIHRKVLEVEMDNGEHVAVSIEKLKMLLNRLGIK